jgi:mono/diheme cytochrome c family protein
MLDTLLRHLPMVRLSVGAFAALLFMGCSGLIDGGDENVTAEEKLARQLFVQKAKPVFDVACVQCHSGSDPSVAFIAGANPMEVRATILASEVVNLEAPQTSRILTKGAHSGPALLASQASDLLEWLSAERDAAGVAGTVDTGLETMPFTPVLCGAGETNCPVTRADISGLVEGWGGAHINFVAQALSQDLYVTHLELEGGPDGVYLEHPLFVSRPPNAEPIPDRLDRFFNVKMNLMGGAAPSQINGGTAAFIDFTPTNPISIHFKVVDRFRPDAGGGGGMMTAAGCKSLTTFKANAKGPLQTNCGSCHANAGNANARGAMDLVGIGATDDTTLQTVCDQARTRINFQDTNSSGFYIAPNPAMATNHQFKFGTQALFDSFKAAVDVWVQAEKTAP